MLGSEGLAGGEVQFFFYSVVGEEKGSFGSVAGQAGGKPGTREGERQSSSGSCPQEGIPGRRGI